MRDRPRKRRYLSVGGLLKNLSLLLATVLVCLALLEIAIRLFTDVPPALTLRHPVVGKTYLPRFEGEVFVPEAGRKVHLRFNREGFRGEDVALERSPDMRRIAVIGDSFVVAVALDEDETMPAQLQRMLSASHPEARWEVLNFGVSSSSTGQEMVLFRELVSRYRPDLVICAFSTLNDFADNSNRLTTQSRVYFELDANGQLVQQSLSATRAAVSRFLNRYSRFYVWQKQATEILKYRVTETIAPLASGSWIFCTADTQELREAWDLNSKLIETFHDEVTSRDAAFALAILPSAEQVYDDVWGEVLERAGDRREQFDRAHAERRLISICSQHDIPMIPMAGFFRSAAESRRLAEADPEQWLFLNGRHHFNSRGSRLAARLIHRYLAEGDGRELMDGVLTRR